MSYLDNNAHSPIPSKNKVFKSCNANQYRSIDSTSLRPLNRILRYNKSEYDTPLSSISNNNFQVYNDKLKYKTNSKINEKRIKKKINNSNSQDLYIINLKNKLNYLRQTNNELNNDYQQIARKSKILINDITKNNSIFAKLKKDYEDGLKKNNAIKQKCHNLLKYIEKAREKDYHIEMNFIGVGDVNLSLQRIDHRVNIGGHGVSEALVRRRYERQFEGLKTAINICDWAWFYDNEVIMRAVAIFEKSKTLFLDQETKWVKAFTEKYAIEKPKVPFLEIEKTKRT